jgi:hypothetical protein
MVQSFVNRWFRLFGLALAFVFAQHYAFAHRLDEYLQATLVSIEPGEIRLQINLTPGVTVAQKVLSHLDLNRDGAISTNEAAAYATSFRKDLTLRLDGKKLEAELVSSDFPPLSDLKTGWGIIKLEYAAKSEKLRTGRHVLTLQNKHLSSISDYLFNAARPASPAIHITKQKRNRDQSNCAIHFTVE